MNFYYAENGSNVRLQENHVLYMSDGKRTLLWMRKAASIDLNSARMWKYFGVTPFVDAAARKMSKKIDDRSDMLLMTPLNVSLFTPMSAIL
jgi:hypothetical protein